MLTFHEAHVPRNIWNSAPVRIITKVNLISVFLYVSFNKITWKITEQCPPHPTDLESAREARTIPKPNYPPNLLFTEERTHPRLSWRKHTTYHNPGESVATTTARSFQTGLCLSSHAVRPKRLIPYHYQAQCWHVFLAAAHSSSRTTGAEAYDALRGLCLDIIMTILVGTSYVAAIRVM